MTHFLLASKVYDENLTENIIENLLFLLNHFPLCDVELLSLSLTFDSLVMSFSVGFFEFMVLGVNGLLGFVDL